MFLLFFFFACNSNESSITKEKQVQSMPKEKYAGVSTLLSDTVVHAQKSDLYGFWTDGSAENATFEIKHDSIYYVEQSTAYKYVMEDGFITIYYPDFVFKGRL